MFGRYKVEKILMDGRMNGTHEMKNILIQMHSRSYFFKKRLAKFIWKYFEFGSAKINKNLFKWIGLFRICWWNTSYIVSWTNFQLKIVKHEKLNLGVFLWIEMSSRLVEFQDECGLNKNRSINNNYQVIREQCD